MKDTLEIIKLIGEYNTYQNFKEIADQENINYCEIYEKEKVEKLKQKRLESPTSYKFAYLLNKWLLN